MISAQTTRRRPVVGSHIRPRRPKSISATSPGALWVIRTVRRLFLCQFRRWMNRLSDVYETRQPRPASSSWMRVSCSRSAVSHWYLVRPGSEQVLCRRLHLPWACNAQLRQAAQLLLTRGWTLPAHAQPRRRCDVPADCRSRQPRRIRYPTLAGWEQPASDHFYYLHSGHLLVRHRCSLPDKCSNGRQSGAQGGQTPGDLA